MPRATWKGYISFGLVNIPVALYSGEKRANVEFDLLDVRDQGKIRYRRVNEVTGEEVPWDQIVRAYEYQDGNYVLMKDEDFNRIAVESTRSLAVDMFVERSTIEPYYFEKPYVVVPDKGGEKSYVLLREAMKEMDRVGIANTVIRGREYLLALMAEGNAIIADRMRFAQELVSPQQFDLPRKSLREYAVSASELDAAEKLVQAMTAHWQPEKYHDDYREALLDWIDKKVRTGEGTTEPEEPAEPTNQVMNEDVMELLQRSLVEHK
jgi:DNA end-binding protein Ku